MDNDFDIVDYVQQLGYSQQTMPSNIKNKHYSVQDFLASLKISSEKRIPIKQQSLKSPHKRQQQYFQQQIYILKSYPQSTKRSFCYKSKPKRSMNSNGVQNYAKIIEIKANQFEEHSQQMINNHKRLKVKDKIRKRILQDIKHYKTQVQKEAKRNFILQPFNRAACKITLEKQIFSNPQLYKTQAFLPLHIKVSKQKQSSSLETKNKYSFSSIKRTKIKLPCLGQKDKI